MADNKPTYDDVFMAILAMDTYHVGTKAVISDPLPGQDVAGYIHNLTGVDEDKGIGTATRGISRAHNTYGFFVASYEWNGKTVIAYRGTSFDGVLGPSAKDVLHGWTLGVG